MDIGRELRVIQVDEEDLAPDSAKPIEEPVAEPITTE